jgi:hypothetical protein
LFSCRGPLFALVPYSVSQIVFGAQQDYLFIVVLFVSEAIGLEGWWQRCSVPRHLNDWFVFHGYVIGSTRSNLCLFGTRIDD